MQLGEVRVAEDTDFQHLRRLCDEDEEWKLDVNKSYVQVWTKNNDKCAFKMVKVRSVLKDIPASVMYDVLHDSDYRKNWDKSMVEGYEICIINPNNDIGYYSLKCTPFKNRDFVTQRSWLDLGSEFMIFNHSVNHEKCPAKKHVVRGVSNLTGYLIRPSDSGGCQLTYVSQSDPKGKLPAWAVNKLTNILAPKVINRLHKAAKNYTSWKSRNNPHKKPWLYPEQLALPKLDRSDIRPMVSSSSEDSIDESSFTEKDFKEDNYKDAADDI